MEAPGFSAVDWQRPVIWWYAFSRRSNQARAGRPRQLDCSGTANRRAGCVERDGWRKLRLEFPGAVYHVINRGNYRSDVFAAEKTKAGRHL